MSLRWVAHRPRRDVLWCLAGLVALQLGLVLAMERWQPGLRDPEYGHKRALLRRRLREQPDRPLALFLGSSRVLNGVRPELLAGGRPGTGPAPVVFNFGLTGHGPLHQLLNLHRVIAEGARPQWVIVEVLPALLSTGDETVSVGRLAWDDLAVLGRSSPSPWRLYADWLSTRVAPWFSHRFCLLHHLQARLGRWLPGGGDRPEDTVWNVDGSGWLALRPIADPDSSARALAYERDRHAPGLQAFHVNGQADQALRALLQLCRREQIQAVLVLMPEGTVYWDWYAPATRAQVDAYMSLLGRTYAVPVVDARDWVPDEGFRDAHHLLPGGAAVFTERFGRKVFWPLLQGGPRARTAGVNPAAGPPQSLSPRRAR